MTGDTEMSWENILRIGIIIARIYSKGETNEYMIIQHSTYRKDIYINNINSIC